VIWLWIAVAVVLVAAGALVPVLSGRNDKLKSNDEAVAARSRYNQLGLYVEDPEQLDDEQATAKLRTARERYDTAGATLAGATTEDDFLLAKRVAEEGLQAVADAYARVGRTGPNITKQKRHK
jgi:type II secretory pathway pseudopilin PulG